MTTLPGKLTHEDLLNLLQLRFNNANIQYQNCEFHSMTDDLNGFMGEHYVLQLTYTLDGAEHTADYFVKTKPTVNEVQKEMADSLNVYKKEIFIYNVLLREYEKRGYNVDFAAKMYICKPGVTMVLEDLKCRDFQLSGRTKFYDVAQMKTCLKSLALFHAASFLYEEDKSKELGTVYRLDQHYATELRECLFTFEDKASIGAKFIQSSVDCFSDLIDLFQEDESWKEDFKRRIQALDLNQLYLPVLRSRKAVGHGDLWSNNMMFRNEDGIATACCLLDFQVVRYYQPAFDVLLAIYNNTRIGLRKEHLQTFMDYYYECLQQAIEERGYSVETIYSRSDYERDMDSLLLAVLLEIACNHSIQFLDMDMVKKAFKEDEEKFKELIMGDRSETLKEAYKHDPKFKATIEEDLYEFHRVLVKK